jgi:hypothetical protein
MIAISSALVATTTASAAVFTFQDGVSGYDGTQDASLYPNGDVDVNTGALTVTFADVTTRSIHKFDVTGMTVTAPATLTFTIADTSLDLPASVNFSVYQITDARATDATHWRRYRPTTGDITTFSCIKPACPFSTSTATFRSASATISSSSRMT